jgi:hypothetical protein
MLNLSNIINVMMINMTRIMSIRLYHIFYVYDYYLIVNAPLLIVPNNDRVKI